MLAAQPVDGRAAAAAGSCSTWPATAAWTWSSFGGPRRVLPSAPTDDGWQPFRPFRSLPEHRLGRPEPALRRPERRRPRRRADHRATTPSPGIRRSGEDGFGDGQARSRQPRGRGAGPAAGARRRHRAVHLPGRHVRRRAAPTWSGSATARSATGPTSATAASAPRSPWTARPWLDQPDQFDQRRVRLADIDGSGTARPDLPAPATASGCTSTSPATAGASRVPLPHAFPRLDSLAHGHGGRPARQRHRVPGLVLAAARRRRPAAALRRPDGRGKPHLLTGSSTTSARRPGSATPRPPQFYLADQARRAAVGHPAAVPGARGRAGRDLRPDQPQPVHHPLRLPPRLLRRRRARVPRLRHGRAVGHRGTRGAGRAATRGGARTWTAATDVPPVLTRTWFHTGVFPDEERVTRQLRPRVLRASRAAVTRTCPTPAARTLRLAGRAAAAVAAVRRRGTREACRALKGSLLRQEVYALDGSEAQAPAVPGDRAQLHDRAAAARDRAGPDGPQNYHACPAHPRPRERHRALRARAVPGRRRAAGRPADHPRPGARRRRLREPAALGVGRLRAPLPRPGSRPGRPGGAGAGCGSTYTENGYTNAVDRPTRTVRRCRRETRTFEVVGPAPRPGGCSASPSCATGWPASPPNCRSRTGTPTGRPAGPPAADQPHPGRGTGATTCPGRCRSASSSRWRCRTGATARRSPTAWSPTCTATGSTPAMLTDGRLRPATARPGGCRPAGSSTPRRRTTTRPPSWTTPGGTSSCRTGSATRSATPRPSRYDRYDLLVSQTRDPLGNLVTAGERDPDDRLTIGGNDYRVLAPRLVSDPNRNRAAVAFDALGLVCGTAVMGKPEERLGDSWTASSRT